jgi:hypothetical protein
MSTFGGKAEAAKAAWRIVANIAKLPSLLRQ